MIDPHLIVDKADKLLSTLDYDNKAQVKVAKAWCCRAYSAVCRSNRISAISRFNEVVRERAGERRDYRRFMTRPI